MRRSCLALAALLTLTGACVARAEPIEVVELHMCHARYQIAGREFIPKRRYELLDAPTKGRIVVGEIMPDRALRVVDVRHSYWTHRGTPDFSMLKVQDVMTGDALGWVYSEVMIGLRVRCTRF